MSHSEFPFGIRRWNKDDPEGWPIDRTSIIDANAKALFINARYAENIEANAEFIVKACNNHERLERDNNQLLEALKWCLATIEEDIENGENTTGFILGSGAIKQAEESK